MSDSMTRRSLAMIVALGMGVAGCSTAGGGASPSGSAGARGVSFARAKAAHRQYGATIRRRYPGVRGTQVGVVVIRSRLPRPGDPVYGIVVLVDRPAHLVEDPQAIGGVPLRFRVSDHVLQH
jgi:hypothetical protein